MKNKQSAKDKLISLLEEKLETALQENRALQARVKLLEAEVAAKPKGLPLKSVFGPDEQHLKWDGQSK